MMTMWTPDLAPHLPRYQAIVEALVDDVAAGDLPDGYQLPPHRDLARALGVSVGTVTRAYALAEQRGLVRGEVGRGTFIGGSPAAKLPIGDTGETVRGGINLGMTWPIDIENPDLAPALRRLVRKKDLAELLTYQPNAGMARHRATGATWVARNGFEVVPERVLLCAGAQHALTVALSTVVKPGEAMLTEELTYPGVRAVAAFLHIKIAGVQVDREGLVPEAFEAACKSGKAKVLYCVPSLHNPTTATLTEARRRAIASIAERHDIAIIEDSIHHLLLDDPPPPIAHFAPERTYLVASPSKVVAGGLRVAFLAAPAHAVAKLAHNIWATNWLVAPLNAEIMSSWIEDGTAEATVARKRTEAAARIRLLREVLADQDVATSPCGYHAWLTLPQEWKTAANFAEAAQRQGVAVTPADSFFVGNGAPPRAIRISVSAPRTHRALVRGLERIAATLATDPNQVTPAIV